MVGEVTSLVPSHKTGFGRPLLVHTKVPHGLAAALENQMGFVLKPGRKFHKAQDRV